MSKIKGLGLILVITLCASSALADNINGINIDFITIGDAGNAADTDTDSNRLGYGSVDYTYRISTREITYAQFSASGLGGGNENYWVVNGVGAGAPVAYVNWLEGAQYCNWLTSGDAAVGVYEFSGGLISGIDRSYRNTNGLAYFLPTEDEWYKAAYYNTISSNYTLYANGSGTAPSTNLLVGARYGLALSNGTPWVVGSGGMEQNGTFDMMGNIYELTETLDGGEVVYRGGGYFQGDDKLAATWRTTDVATANFKTVGLRVASIPEPGTISLMSLNTLGLFLTRSIRRRKRLGQSLFPIFGQQYLQDEFYTEDACEAVEEDDYFSVVGDLVKSWCLCMWTRTHAVYRKVDTAFWNRMVAIHERKVVRRAAIRKAVRKRLLDCFDSCLERIMK